MKLDNWESQASSGDFRGWRYPAGRRSGPAVRCPWGSCVRGSAAGTFLGCGSDLPVCRHRGGAAASLSAGFLCVTLHTSPVSIPWVSTDGKASGPRLKTSSKGRQGARWVRFSICRVRMTLGLKGKDGVGKFASLLSDLSSNLSLVRSRAPSRKQFRARGSRGPRAAG